MNELTPEHYAVMSANLHRAQEINAILTTERNQAEARFIKIRSENDDLQEEVAALSNQVAMRMRHISFLNGRLARARKVIIVQTVLALVLFFSIGLFVAMVRGH